MLTCAWHFITQNVMGRKGCSRSQNFEIPCKRQLGAIPEAGFHEQGPTNIVYKRLNQPFESHVICFPGGMSTTSLRTAEEFRHFQIGKDTLIEALGAYLRCNHGSPVTIHDSCRAEKSADRVRSRINSTLRQLAQQRTKLQAAI